MEYNINLNVKFGHHELIDIPSIISECDLKHFNQTLTQVNDSVVRLGIIEGEFHWHKHDNDDEFFYVIDGEVYMDIEDKSFLLKKGQGITVSKGVMHRPRAPKRVVLLMVETKEIKPKGDSD